VADSNAYGDVINNVTSEAEKSIDAGAQSNSLTSGVSQSISTAYPEKQFNQEVTSFLSGNLAWLKGQTKLPEFNINLNATKQAFATQIGSLMQARVAALPSCSSSADTIAALSTLNPLSLTCRPAGLRLASVDTQISSDIENSNVLLSTSVFTPNSINVSFNGSTQPYYQKLSALPKVYVWAERVPFILGLLALLWALGIVVFSSRKRKGLRRVSIVLVISALLLAITRVGADRIGSKVSRHLTTNSSLSYLESSATNFAHYLVSSLTTVGSWFAAAYLVLAVIILGYLYGPRLFNKNRGQIRSSAKRPANVEKVAETDPLDDQPDSIKDSAAVKLAPHRSSAYRLDTRPVMRPTPGAPVQPTAPPLPHRPPRPPHRPRLIQ
jgi:hypothetical protein